MSDKAIAVVGASKNRSKFGNKCVRAYKSAGWDVYPINPHEEEIEGLSVYRSLEDIPAPLDRISLYLSPPRTRLILTELAGMSGVEVWFNPGSADRPILEEARTAGIEVREGCSIVDIGMSPAEFS